MRNEMKGHSYRGEYRSAIARAKKILTEAGFPWSVTTGRYTAFANTQKTSAGVRVTRVGCSETIALHCHDAMRGGGYTKEAAEVRRFIEYWARETLKEAGMPFDDRGWLACGRDANF